MSCFDKLCAKEPILSMDNLNNKLHYLLNDELAQNRKLSPELFQQCAKEKIDQLPHALGEFGRSPSNPILVNGPLGEITYLSKLVLSTSQEKIFFHKLCTCNEKINVYEITSQSGKFYDLLFVDMYHLHKSSIAPSGYDLQKEVKSIRGINQLCKSFPANLYEDLLQVSEELLGFPVIDSDVKKIDLDKFRETIQTNNNKRN